jgi:hypothetical protein
MALFSAAKILVHTGKSRTVLNSSCAVLSVLALVVTASACRSRQGAPAPEAIVDRSDGTLPTLTAPHVNAGEITIDGNLNEARWSQAGSTRALVHPGNGRYEPGSRVNGSAKFLWSDEFLYVAAVIGDPDPAAPFARDAVDPHLWERSSAIELMIQPGNHDDNQHYYELQVDTVGARWETLFDDYNNPRAPGPDGQMRFGHQEWSTQMQTAARVERGQRYTLEIAVPWRNFDGAGRATVPPAAGDVWKMNVYSFRDGQGDSLAWSPIMGRGNFHFSQRFGRVTFAR